MNGIILVLQWITHQNLGIFVVFSLVDTWEGGGGDWMQSRANVG